LLTLPTAATPAARSAGTSSPPHTTPYTAGGEVASGGANNKSGLGSYRLGWTAFVPLAPDNSSAAEDNPAARRTDTTDLQMLQDDHTKPACRPLHLNCHQPLTPHPPHPPPPPHPSLRLFSHELCPKHPVQRGNSRGLIPPF